MIQVLRKLTRKMELYPLRLLLERSPSKAMIEKDIHRWILMHNRPMSGSSVPEKLAWLMYAMNLEEFRNVLFYRIGTPTKFLDRSLLSLCKTLFPPRGTLLLATSAIGPGLVIMHGFGTFVDAEKVGENCLIFQDVVIGCKNEKNDRPTIGNYVHISVGAKVLGNITIGDHAVIAANSVVTKDMPPNSLAVGIPARIIRNAGNRAEYVASGDIPA